MSVPFRTASVAAALLMLGSGNAIAQATYAELESKGIKTLSGDEVKQLLSGARIKGESAPGQSYEYELAPDGTMSGKVVDGVRGSNGLIGKWSVSASQQYCWEYTLTHTRASSGGKGCRRLFKLGEDYYIPVAGTGKEAKMGKVSISK